MNYRISIPEQDVKGLNEHVFGLSEEHSVEILEKKILYDNETRFFDRLKSFIVENKYSEKSVKMRHVNSGYHAAVEEYLPHGICMHSACVAALMKELAPDADYQLTYQLKNDDPGKENPMWLQNFVLEIKPGLSKKFFLDVKDTGVFPIILEEVVEANIEKIPEDSDKQRKEAAAGKN